MLSGLLVIYINSLKAHEYSRAQRAEKLFIKRANRVYKNNFEKRDIWIENLTLASL